MPPKKNKESPDKSGSPKKDSPKKSKDSPKKDKDSPKKQKGSPDKKGSPKKGKKEPEEPEPELPKLLKKIAWTFPDLADYVFKQFRCSLCTLVYTNFQQFINHCCWRKFYIGRFHFPETQTFCCRTCDRLYNNEADYASHECRNPVPEETLPLTYQHYFNFYINWERRVKEESEPHEPDWKHFCKCLNCGDRFKKAMHYLIHSCFQYSMVKPEVVNSLCYCSICKYVMLDVKQFEDHLKFCNKEKAIFMNFTTSLFERACHQFVLGRHCHDYNLNKQKFVEPDSKRLHKIPVGCFTCGIVQENIMEFLCHPCVAGKLITPFDMELIILCNDCCCLFINYEECDIHTKSCEATRFTFIRFTQSELKWALQRWCVDIRRNTMMPERPPLLMCTHCFEIFRSLKEILLHLCPRRPECIRYFMQPLSLIEMYSCETCFSLVFSSVEATIHSNNCTMKNKTLMIRIHPTYEECLICLEYWSRLPRLLEMDLYLGVAVKEIIYP